MTLVRRYKTILIISLLAFIGVASAFYGLRMYNRVNGAKCGNTPNDINPQNDTSQNNNLPITPTKTPTKPTVSPVAAAFEVQAWMYPGEPSCNAMSEIKDGRVINTLKPEYFKIDTSGTLVLLTEENDGCNGFSTANVALVKKYSQKQFVTVSSDTLNMRVLFKSPTLTNSTIATLKDFVVKYGFTGVELDFEDFSSWTKSDYASYKNFLVTLGTTLHGVNKQLMVDAPPLTKDLQQYYVWNYIEFNALPVDYVVTMVYDYQYDAGMTGFVAPNAWVKDVINYIKPQFTDITRFIVGVPTYGYHSSGDNKFKLDTKEQSSKYSGFSTAKKSPDSYEYYWNKNGVFYVFQSKEGIKQKVDLIRSLGINQISIWHLGGNDWF